MPLIAVRRRVGTGLIQQHEVDAVKVKRLVAHLSAGGQVPPVVVALYGDRVLPLDGHHRLLAYAELGVQQVDAWVVAGSAFDRLCTQERNAEKFVICDGVAAMDVAGQWRPQVGVESDHQPGGNRQG